jgi:hypothetical protein
LAFSEAPGAGVLDFSAAPVEAVDADSLDEDSAFEASLRDSDG